jgi:hypothetical protein
MVDVENLDRLFRDPIEQSVWISNEGNDPDTRTLCDLARAFRPCADALLDHPEPSLKSR